MTVTAIVPVPARFALRPEALLAPVAGLSPLVRVVKALAATCDVVVAAAEPIIASVRESLAEEGVSSLQVVLADPPGERAQCVAAGLRDVAGGSPVVVHDVEWPLVGAGTVERIVASLQAGAVAVMPARPVTDSIKAVDAAGVVRATLDRAPLRTVQYPRGFDSGVLAQLVAHGASGAFDELEVALSTGTPVTLIDGDDDALSVELPRDAAYLAALIEGRHDVAGR